MTTIHIEPKDVAQIIATTFPGYRGKTVKVTASETVSLYDLNWSGGSRNQYRTCTIDGQPMGSADRFNAMAPWDNVAEGKSLPIPQGFVCVEHSIFCGKDTGLTVYVNPADMPRYLPSKPELTADERLILDATRSLKASYNGMDRYEMKRRDAYPKPFMSRDQWETVKAGLVAKGLLDKRGAITLAGKNAIAR